MLKWYVGLGGCRRGCAVIVRLRRLLHDVLKLHRFILIGLQLSRRRELEKKIDTSLQQEKDKLQDERRTQLQEKQERERVLRRQLAQIVHARINDEVV
jgi:hypothetical protein